MTDDPVKLYVIVMAILVGVLGWVANASYNQAHDYETAIAAAPRDAKRFRELAERVTSLAVTNERPQRVGGKGKELRWKVSVTRTSRGGTKPVTRNQIARFCRQVELDSRGILKVIEIKMNRTQSEGSPPVGSPTEIRNDRYTTTIVVGMRVID